MSKIKDKNTNTNARNTSDQEIGGVNKSNVSLVSGISQLSGAGYLTNLMNPKNVSSVQTMNIGDNNAQ